MYQNFLPLVSYRHKKLNIGTCVSSSEMIYHENFIKEMYSSTVPGSASNWIVISPNRGEYKTDELDKIIDLSLKYNKSLVGFYITWGGANPQWLLDITDPEELKDALLERLTFLGERYANIPKYWFINEICNSREGELDDPPWKPIGMEYIKIIADEAKKYGVIPCINEGFPKVFPPITPWLNTIVEAINYTGIKHVGLQMHQIYDHEAVSQIEETMNALDSLGVTVEITEMDVRIPLPLTQEKLSMQAFIYAEILQTMMKYKNFNREVTIWGCCDKHSWIPYCYPGYGGATLFDEQLNPKPAYQVMHDLLGR